MLSILDDKVTLFHTHDNSHVWVEPWGENAVRVRATSGIQRPRDRDWALSIKQHTTAATAKNGELTNGKIRATLTTTGKLTISNAVTKSTLLEEYVRNRMDPLDPNCSSLDVEAREFSALAGGVNSFHISARFESQASDERIYGMGQYQQSMLNLKGADLELAQRNSQASVPFAVSNLGYGLLWNNPAVGRASFGSNVMTFESYSSDIIDYWVVAGDTPAEIVQAYAKVSGTVPMMPEYGMGFWQCKLRYQTQDELLGVVRRHKQLGLPMDVIVCDFFHWALQGDWCFDPTYWPDPAAMIAELKQHNVELMVSIWPTVDKRSKTFDVFRDAGHLIRTDRGSHTSMDFQGECRIVDFTSVDAQKAMWAVAKKNYFDLGIKVFWLDEAEPEFIRYSYDHFRGQAANFLTMGNAYPVDYAKAFYNGQTAAGQTNVVNLLRCAWAGSQRYGALVWSGDIASSWTSFRRQLSAGLSMGMAGIPWWTTDIGGFHGGHPADPAFRELLVRWFQWGAYCPVMRLHGDREPHKPQHGTTGGATCLSGADNEVWSYGEAVQAVCTTYLLLRERMRDYTRTLMAEAHKVGSPVMRTMFYVFPEDDAARRCEDQYMFGDRYLVAPVLAAGQRKRTVYLPKGARWQRVSAVGDTAEVVVLQGGQVIEAAAPLEEMPVYERVL